MRLLDILFYLLRNNSKVTIKSLSDIFKVSTKTIRRDLDKLSILGIPIIIHRGPSGGVEIDKNYIISKHLLRYSDYESLIIALYICENLNKNTSYSYLIDKFKSIDQERASKIIKKCEDRLIIDLYEEKTDTKNEIYEEINKALDYKVFIEVKINGKIYEVYPINYVLRKEGLCLYCYGEEYMIILINQISQVAICNKKYEGDIIEYKENKEKIKVI